MSIDPYSRGLGYMDLTAFPFLIHAADRDTSELVEVEWKVHWDFSKANPKRAELAKHIVAMANRDPDVSARLFSGFGFIVIGVEPGNLRGTDPLDPADVDQLLRGYTGHQIGWRSANVKYEGVNVIVIVVDPPRWGDPVFELMRTSEDEATGEKFVKGTVYVRRQGNSVPASPDEIALLQVRAGTARSRVSVTSSWNLGKSGDFVKVRVRNEPHGLSVVIETVGFMFPGEIEVSETESASEDPDSMKGLGSFPFKVVGVGLDPGRNHDFIIPLGRVPALIDEETELFPYCEHSGGQLEIGESFRFAEIVGAGWKQPEVGKSMFPILKVDVVHPREKFGSWNTSGLEGWEEVDEIPPFGPPATSIRGRLRRPFAKSPLKKQT